MATSSNTSSRDKIAVVLSIISVIIVVVNLTLFVLGFFNSYYFWGITIVMAILAYVVIPRIKG